MPQTFLIRNTNTNVVELVYDFPVNVSPPLELVPIDQADFRDDMVGSIFQDEQNYKPRPGGVDSDGRTYYESDGTNWQDVRSDDEVWRMVRLRRNVELLESDWTQLDDSQLNPSDKGRWTAYRQQLRVLPDNNPNNPRQAETQLNNLLNGNGPNGQPGQGKPPTDRESTIPLMVRTLP